MDVQFIMIMTIFVWKTENGPILPRNIDVLTHRQNVLKTNVPTRIHHQCNGPTTLLAYWPKGFENTRPDPHTPSMAHFHKHKTLSSTVFSANKSFGRPSRGSNPGPLG